MTITERSIADAEIDSMVQDATRFLWRLDLDHVVSTNTFQVFNKNKMRCAQARVETTDPAFFSPLLLSPL